MQDAMVTARMSKGKKEQGSAVLEQLGISSSAAINSLFDYVIKNKDLPFGKKEGVDAGRIKEAIAWADSVCLPEDNRFATMSDDEIRKERLRHKGLM